MSGLFTSDGQSTGASASASVLPMNIQGWLPLGWTDLIPLQSKGPSRVFSSTKIQKHQFFSTQPSLWSSSHMHTWLLEEPQLWVYRPLSAKWCLGYITLSRFVIAFLSRSKHILISWLQSPSAVILEPKKIKSVTISIFFPHLLAMKWWDQMPMILVFWMLNFKPTLSLSSFTIIKRLFSSSLLHCHKGGIICISEVIVISPSNLDSSSCFFQSGILDNVLCV